MKHFGLAPVTVLTIGLTGVLLPYSGWFAGRSSARPPAHLEPQSQSRSRQLPVEATLRFRSAQPYHWRNLVLHHR